MKLPYAIPLFKKVDRNLEIMEILELTYKQVSMIGNKGLKQINALGNGEMPLDDRCHQKMGETNSDSEPIVTITENKLTLLSISAIHTLDRNKKQCGRLEVNNR